MERPTEVRPYACEHRTCRACAVELSKRLMKCPQCRASNPTAVGWSFTLSHVFVVMNCGTEMESPEYTFCVSASLMRSLRMLRRTDMCAFKKAIVKCAQLALWQNNYLSEVALDVPVQHIFHIPRGRPNRREEVAAPIQNLIQRQRG